MPTLTSRVLLEGAAEASLLRLESDLSLWGGVDPASGAVIDSRHPQFGECLTDRILAMERSIGSSSGSAILLEMMRLGIGPAGIILTEADYIVTLGAVVARELGYGCIPVLQVSAEDLGRLAGSVRITEDGTIRY